MYNLIKDSAAIAAKTVALASVNHEASAGLFATIFAFLASATFIWVFAIVAFIVMAILLEKEFEGWATTVFSLTIALFLWNFKTEIWTFLSTNPVASISFAVSYVVIGIVWSFIKWRTHLKDIFDRFKEVKKEFLSTHKTVDETNKEDFFHAVVATGIKDNRGRSVDYGRTTTMESFVEKITPIASKKKSVITSWISYWPVSLIATLLNNPFRKFFEMVYSNISGFYDKITNSYKAEALKF